MRAPITLKHKFVESAPDQLEDKILYVSVRYRVVIHKCCCGCGQEVVTPLGPTDWKLIFDGVSISLDPSVGNWGLPCRSHYWIKKNRAHWAEKWSEERIVAGRAKDRLAKARYYEKNVAAPAATPTASDLPVHPSFGARLRYWFRALGKRH